MEQRQVNIIWNVPWSNNRDPSLTRTNITILARDTPPLRLSIELVGRP